MIQQKCLSDGQTESETAFPSHLFDFEFGGAVSDYFCNFPALATPHWHPLHTVIEQLSRGEKVSWVWSTSLSPLFSLYTQLLLSLFVYTNDGNTFNAFQERLNVWMKAFSLWQRVKGWFFYQPLSVTIWNSYKLRQPLKENHFRRI